MGSAWGGRVPERRASKPPGCQGNCGGEPDCVDCTDRDWVFVLIAVGIAIFFGVATWLLMGLR